MKSLPNIRQVEAFVLIANLRSVTQAAARMNLTQSAVSILLRQFEEFTGAQLFERCARSLEPTRAALSLLPAAEQIIREATSLKRTAARLHDELSGRVRFAATASLTSSTLPPILTAFRRMHPEVELIVEDISHHELLAGLLEGQIDFSVGGAPNARLPELNYEPLACDPLVAIRQRPAGGDAPPATLRWQDLAAEETIVTVGRGGGLRELIDRRLRDHDIAFEPHFEFRLGTTAIAMVMDGLGVGVMPMHLIPAHCAPGLLVQRLVDPVIERDVVAITRRSASPTPAMNLFLAALRAGLAEQRAAPFSPAAACPD